MKHIVTRRTVLKSSLASAAVLTVGQRAVFGQETGPIKLGMVAPFSGRLAPYGTSGRPGVEFAIKEINESGGIKSLGGRQLVLIPADTKGDTKITVSETERLILDEKVAGIIGPFSSVDSLTANPLSDEYQIPFVSPYWTSAKAFDLNSKFARTINLTSEAYATGTITMLKVLRDKYNVPASKIANVYDSGEYGSAIGRNINELLQAEGLPPVIDLPVTPPVTDFAPTVLRIKNSGAEVVLAAFYFQEAVLFLRACDALEFRQPIIASASGFTDGRLPEALGGAVAARALEIPIFGANKGLQLSSKYGPLQDFLKRSAAEPQHPGNTPALELDWYALGAQSVYVFANALEKAASTDGPQLNEAILENSFKRGDAKLILPFYDPELAWEENGKPKNQMVSFSQWQGGKIVTVYPEDVADSPPKL